GRADQETAIPGSGTSSDAETRKNGSPSGASVLAYLCRNGSLIDQANEAFYKASWSQAWRSPAYFLLAEIATRRGDFTAAFDLVNHSLEANSLNIRALNLKAALLRHTGKDKDALQFLSSAAQLIDPLDVRVMTERWLAGDKKSQAELGATLRDHPATG